MRPRAIVFCIFIVAVMVMAPMAEATQIIYRTPKQMGAQSSLVVSGTVAGVHSYWNDTRTKIFTETVVNIDETFKGQPISSVRIIQLGGTVGIVKITVAGALQWKVGEEVLLFLESYRDDVFQVSGFSQGKFEVERDPRTGERYIRRDALVDTEVLGAEGRDGAAPASRAMRVPLQRFVDDALNRR